MCVWFGGVKLAAWARSVSVHPQTAYGWVREDRNRMPVPFRRLPSGTILVDVAVRTGDQRVVLYARVCSHDQRSDLDRRVARLAGWATDSGFEVGQVVAEVGSRAEWETPEVGPGVVVPFCQSDCCGASGSAGAFWGGASAGGPGCSGPPDRGRRGARNRALRAVTATEHPESAVEAAG